MMSPRPLVYMDHWALSDISGDAKLHGRMLRILQRGTLLFSSMNLMETARAKGATLENIASFLDDVGDRWAPISLNSTEVGLRERAGILEPWRDEQIPLWVRHAPRVDGKLSKLVRRGQEPWAAEALKRWEQEEGAAISAMTSVARERVRKGTLKLDGWSDVPDVLDAHGVFATVLQRYARGTLKVERHQIDDLLHLVVPVAHADVVFLDRKTKSLLERMNTRAKVFSKREIEAAFQQLEALLDVA